MPNQADLTYSDSDRQPCDPAETLMRLKQGLQRFLSGHSMHPHATKARRHQLIGGQHPQVVVLACSDSRVPVEVIFDAGFGDLFVIRNAGNTITNSSIASIEYAVQNLDIKVLLIMSHQGCGAVKAAYLDHPKLTPSLTELVTGIRHDLKQNGFNTSDSSNYNEACIEHSHITAQRLFEQSEMVRKKVNQKALLLQPAFLQIDPLAITWMDCIQDDTPADEITA